MRLIEERDRTLTPSQERLFETLAASHQAAFTRLARRLAPTPEDAEDLLQETLIDAYRGFHGFRPETRFYTWVARIMTNNQLDRVRRKRHPVVSLDQGDATTSETLDLPDEASNPERILLQEELDHPFQSALEALQPVHRATVMLCDLRGATYEEAAQEEQCPVGTIRSRLHRAHKAIRSFLSRLAEPEPEPASHRIHSRRAFLQMGTAAAAGAFAGLGAEEARADAPIRVLVWSEGTASKKVYPQDISGAIAAALRADKQFDVRVAGPDDPEQGLSDAQLQETDVLIWWGDRRQDEVRPDRLRAAAARVREGMGLIALHAAHRGGPLPVVLQSACSWAEAAREGEPVDLTAAAPRHPIAQGLQRFRIARGAAHAGVFDAPRPDLVVFDGSLPSGDRVWQGVVWTRGRGRVFYFQPGHPEHPIYHQEEVRQVLRNAVRWCAHRPNAEAAPAANDRA